MASLVANFNVPLTKVAFNYMPIFKMTIHCRKATFPNQPFTFMIIALSNITYFDVRIAKSCSDPSEIVFFFFNRD